MKFTEFMDLALAAKDGDENALSALVAYCRTEVNLESVRSSEILIAYHLAAAKFLSNQHAFPTYPPEKVTAIVASLDCTG